MRRVAGADQHAAEGIIATTDPFIHYVYRYFYAHCIASFGVAIALAVPHGIPSCSSAFEYFVFAPLGVPVILIAPLLGAVYTWRNPVDIVIAYLAYVTLFAFYVLLSRPTSHMRNQTTCPTCGYNLTGNTSGICPECGNPTPLPPSIS